MATISHVQICTEDCVGKVLDFLQSTEECRNDKDIQDLVVYLEDRICSFRDGIDNPESSCALIFNDSFVGDVIEGCIGWWVDPTDPAGEPARDSCPLRLSPGAAFECSAALQQASDDFGCCFTTIYSNEEIIANLTEYVRTHDCIHSTVL